MANRISVLDGANETTLCAGPSSVISRPSPSVKVNAVGVGVARGAHAVSSTISKVKSKVLRNIFILLK
jgi:hypothetical protein